jgi:CRP-like cAMP-binding protein
MERALGAGWRGLKRCRSFFILRAAHGAYFLVRIVIGSDRSPRGNRLLEALSPETLRLLQDDLEPVALPLGSTVYEAGSETSHLYFPTEGIISMLEVTEDGSTAEIAVVGNEGVVGISVFMGGKTTPSRAVVQSAASAERLRAQVLQREFRRGGELQVLLLRYTMALITQMSQTAVCYRHHSAEQQLCRWLLMSMDRLPGNELVMTQELIADMLGVRRQSVTEAASKLQADGVIRYARGRITTLDRSRLEQRACECYTVVKKEYERLLSNGG